MDRRSYVVPVARDYGKHNINGFVVPRIHSCPCRKVDISRKKKKREEQESQVRLVTMSRNQRFT